MLLCLCCRIQTGFKMEIPVEVNVVEVIPLRQHPDREEGFYHALFRVPALVLLDASFRTDLMSTLEGFGLNSTIVFIIITILQFTCCCVVVFFKIMPTIMLARFYCYGFTALLMAGAGILSNIYVHEEEADGFQGIIFTDIDCLLNWIMYAMAQFILFFISWGISNSKQGYLFTAFLFPLIARLIPYFPLTELRTVHTFSTMFTIIQGLIAVYQMTSLSDTLEILAGMYQIVLEAVEEVGFVRVLIALYNHFFVPPVYLLFWLICFGVHLVSHLVTSSQPLWNENWIIVLLSVIADCCDTVWTLIGLCFTVSYLACGILTLTKVYLQGSEGFMNDNVLHRGWTEGITLLLLTIQTGILEMKKVQKIFLLSIVLFVVFASTLQSMHEITEPVLMSLTAANNRDVLCHIKVLLMCVFLFLFPLYMTYIICMFFEAEFWLLVIVSSSVLTSVQMLASTFTYLLFMIDNNRKEPWENLDDIVYCIKALSHILEFCIAISVLVYGATETAYSDHSVLSAVIIVVHCYFNVWKRAQMGWESFLQRRDAMRKVETLPVATQEQLDMLNDVCAICYQDMRNARVTPCNHIFHSLCLRKWLYVQDKCPLCHSPIIMTKETETTQNG